MISWFLVQTDHLSRLVAFGRFLLSDGQKCKLVFCEVNFWLLHNPFFWKVNTRLLKYHTGWNRLQYSALYHWISWQWLQVETTKRWQMIARTGQIVPWKYLHGYIDLYRLKFLVKSPNRWSLFHPALHRCWRHFQRLCCNSRFHIGLSTQGVWSLIKKWCNYDVTVSNDVNLCDPRFNQSRPHRWWHRRFGQ